MKIHKVRGMHWFQNNFLFIIYVLFRSFLYDFSAIQIQHLNIHMHSLVCFQCSRDIVECIFSHDFVLLYIYIYILNKKSLNLKRVLYPKLYDDMPILFLGSFLEPYELFNYIILY